MKSNRKTRTSKGAGAAFHAQERWCAVGDSLTQSGFYHQYIDLYYATRFPENRLELFNGGINGDTAARLLIRLEADVLIHQPTVVTILLGANDVSQSFPAEATAAHIKAERAKAVAAYRDNMRLLLTRLQQAGVPAITASVFLDAAVSEYVALAHGRLGAWGLPTLQAGPA